jgi:hypothetical protein
MLARPSRQVAELLAEHLQIPPEQRLHFLKVARQRRTGAGTSSASGGSGEVACSEEGSIRPYCIAGYFNIEKLLTGGFFT